MGGDALRGRALGLVLFATAVGAVASPNLLGPSGDVARALGLPTLSGLYLVAAVVFPVAAVLIGVASTVGTTSQRRTGGLGPPRDQRVVTKCDFALALRPLGARVALFALASTNLVMVAVMAIAPVHLIGHGETLGVIGVVITVHVAGMFAPSLVSGWLADRIGPTAVTASGSGLLLTAAMAGALIPSNSTPALTLVLLVLGIGCSRSRRSAC